MSLCTSNTCIIVHTPRQSAIRLQTRSKGRSLIAPSLDWQHVVHALEFKGLFPQIQTWRCVLSCVFLTFLFQPGPCHSADGTAPQGRAQDARDEAEREKGGSRPHPGQRAGGSHAPPTGRALPRNICRGRYSSGRSTTFLCNVARKATDAKYIT